MERLLLERLLLVGELVERQLLERKLLVGQLLVGELLERVQLVGQLVVGVELELEQLVGGRLARSLLGLGQPNDRSSTAGRRQRRPAVLPGRSRAVPRARDGAGEDVRLRSGRFPADSARMALRPAHARTTLRGDRGA